MESEIKPRMENNIGGTRNNVMAHANGSPTSYKITRRETSTLSSSAGSNKPPSKGVRKNNMTLTKDFKAGLLAIKDQSYVQSFLFQFNIHYQGNK